MNNSIKTEMNTELNQSYLVPVVYMDLSNNSFEYFNPDSSLFSSRTAKIELIDLSNNLLNISSVCKIQDRLNSEKSRIKDVVNVDFYPQSDKVESWSELCNFLISVKFSTGEMDSRPLFHSCDEYSRNFTLTCLIIEHQKDKWLEHLKKAMENKKYRMSTRVNKSISRISRFISLTLLIIVTLVILFWIFYLRS